MTISDIEDPELRAMFEEIGGLSNEELSNLELNAVIRGRLLKNIVVADQVDQCWFWKGSHLQCGGKPRPVICFKGKQLLAYRVLMSLRLREPLSKLGWILHCCGDHEDGRCINPLHLRKGTARDNALDRSRFGAISGDRNGSRLRPETRPRGRRHPKSQFQGQDGVRIIQVIRATYDAAEQKQGLIYALARHFDKSPNAVTGVVKRWRYNDIPDDPTAGLDVGALQINRPSDSAKRRTKWPAGDEYSGTRMPMAAKLAFVMLFHRVRDCEQRRVLCEFVAKRYGISFEAIRNLGYGNPEKFGAPAKEVILQFPTISSITLNVLDGAFGDFPLTTRGCVA